jgi:hypothetical protein
MSNMDYHQRPRTPPWYWALETASSSKAARYLYDTLGVYQVACDYEELYRAAESEEERQDLFRCYRRKIARVIPQKLIATALHAFAVDWVLFGGYVFYVVPIILVWVVYILKGK